MYRKFLTLIFPFMALFFFFQNSANAQFETGKNYIGPTIGLSFLGSTPDFGVNYEYGLNFQDFGKVGIGGLFKYWGYSESYFDGKWNYTNILIGAHGNYHFVTSSGKFDPYIGLVLAYDAGSVSWSGPYGNYSTPAYGGMWLAAQGGARYWISPSIAISGRIGFGTLGYSGLDLGVDFKF
jgi:hypothetical protein